MKAGGREATPCLRALGAALLLFVACEARADRQLDPALREVVKQAIAEGACFVDKYDAEVWYKLMEPRLRRYVKDAAERLEILRNVYCEAKNHELPAELVLAACDNITA